MTRPLVSVFTLAYNHAPYIARCIEGALMQKTDFPIEVVIGEDCSTDGTRDIVFSYARKYPERLRTVTSDSNVGMAANAARTFQACQGEYIAFCEGDDYWIDPLKLQKQYDAAVKYDAVLVVHGSIFLLQDGSKLIGANVRQAKEQTGFLSAEDVIFGLDDFHTSSLFVRADLFPSLRGLVLDMSGADYTLKLRALGQGKIYYIHEIMSIRQKGVSGSWTEIRANRERAAEHWRAEYERNHLAMLMEFDAYTEHKYASLIRRSICDRLARYCERNHDLDLLETTGVEKAALQARVHIASILPGRLRGPAIRRLAERSWESSKLKGRLEDAGTPS
jgi:glycosyltransferase involved in cell wall biosynthesis